LKIKAFGEVLRGIKLLLLKITCKTPFIKLHKTKPRPKDRALDYLAGATGLEPATSPVRLTGTL
jgi:hypothetical protein